jgi:haloalkane dehalogenase
MEPRLGDTAAGRPDWFDDELFPFQSRFMQVDGNYVHYIDEGSGPPLLMVHGNPTWSFVFRDLVAALRNCFRCVVPDLPGFGLSWVATRLARHPVCVRTGKPRPTHPPASP